MEVFEAMMTRRSVAKVRPDKPPSHLIEKILEAGTWAPNHYLTQPWRFVVLSGKALNKLGDAMAEGFKDELSDPGSEENKVKIEQERARPLRAPVIITVIVASSDNPKVLEDEEYAAVAAAAQNMLLAAHALGLGAYLRTGPAVYRKKVHEFFGIKGKEKIYGFIYLGYPEATPPGAPRASFKEKTQWME